MSDRVAVMFGGEILQCAAPEEIYYRPGARRVADYFGDCHYISGTVKGNNFTAEELSCRVDLPEGDYDLMLRSTAILTEQEGPLVLTVKEIRFRGADTLVTLEGADGKCWHKPLREMPSWQTGQQICCGIDEAQMVFFPKEK